jgi:hypothetical protein
MRHGRKSKSKRFNGFKRHLAADVDRGLILACAITPANRPEEEAMPSLTIDMKRQGLVVDQLLIDRGYINSALVDDVLGRRGTIVCKPGKVAPRPPVSEVGLQAESPRPDDRLPRGTRATRDVDAPTCASPRPSRPRRPSRDRARS